MGEIADMMLEGFLCEGCGEWMGDDEGPGYARLCAACRRQVHHPDVATVPPKELPLRKSRRRRRRL